MKERHTLSSRWMIIGTNLASMTACTCCWLPAVMLDRNHTASCRTNDTNTSQWQLWLSKTTMESWTSTCHVYRFNPQQRGQGGFTVKRTNKDLIKQPPLLFRKEYFQVLTGSESKDPPVRWTSGRDRVLRVGRGWFWGSNHQPCHNQGGPRF